MSDELVHLVEQCLAGDQVAFGRLYQAYAGRSRAYFLRSGFAPADADDMMQETFIRVVRSLRTYDSAKGDLGAWIAAIARNVARKQWAVRAGRDGFDPQLAEAVLAWRDPPTAESQEEIAALQDCIAALPEELAGIIRLRYVESRTTRGISEAAGMPEATVRLRLEQAKEALAKCLRGKGILE